MRERGITRPGLKAAISAALAVGAALAVAWSAQDPAMAGEPGSALSGARNLGIVVVVVGTLATLNFLYALSLVRKLRRGEGVIGSWTVSSARFQQFRAAERALKRRKNNWRMPRGAWPEGLPVIFSADAVLVGHSYFRLSARGISRFSYVRIEQEGAGAPGGVPSIEFAMTLTIHGAGPQSRTARYRGHLRIPIADAAAVEAARVVSHFKAMV